MLMLFDRDVLMMIFVWGIEGRVNETPSKCT